MAGLFIMLYPCPAEHTTQPHTNIAHVRTLCHQGKFDTTGMGQFRVCVSFYELNCKDSTGTDRHVYEPVDLVQPLVADRHKDSLERVLTLNSSAFKGILGVD
jgi:hypothetical protein